MPETLSAEAKVALFASLFKGRPDVYAQRWERFDGTASGYFPVHTDRTKTQYAVLTSAHVEEHLRGNKVIGIYPLLSDNSSWFVAADFDGENWQTSVHSLCAICKKYNLPTYIERSRSGNGAHVWWFFEAHYPAYKSRSIFLRLLKLSGIIDQFDSEESFDRLFPSQDYLSAKGLGNLIALPLQGSSRKEGNSIFLDPEKAFAPYDNQWAFLQSIQRIPPSVLDILFGKFHGEKPTSAAFVQHTGNSIPITIGSQLTIPKACMFPDLANFLSEHLNFFNTEYAVKQRMGLSTYGVERYFRTIEKDDEHIHIPRGFLHSLLTYLQEQKIPNTLHDIRTIGEPVKYSFSCSLFDYQTQAVRPFVDHETGILVAPPGSGKTIMGLALVTERKQSALIIVHREQILKQWLERIEHFLGIPKKKIGRIAGASKKILSPVTVAMVQSLARLETLNELSKQFGLVLVDECHHMPAKMFRQVITQLSPRYLYGLTATPARKHNDERLIFIYLGDVVHEVKNNPSKTLQSEGTKDMQHKNISIIIRDTTLAFPFKVTAREHHTVAKALSFDTARNELIIKDITAAVIAGKKCLILTERKEHVEMMACYLKRKYEIITLSGDLTPKQRKLREQQMRHGHFQIIIATGQLVGEGTHFAYVDALFLVYPFAFEGKLVQYIGRILHSDSTEKAVYDYHDKQIPYLDRMFKYRQKYYNKQYPSANVEEDNRNIPVQL